MSKNFDVASGVYYSPEHQFSNPNLLMNGNFDAWQRGNSLSNGQGYIADRWFCNLDGASVDRGLNGYFNGRRMSSIIITRRIEGSLYSLTQVIENGFDILKGKTATLSMSIYSTVSGELSFDLYNYRLAKRVNFTSVSGFNGNGRNFTVHAGWQKITLTVSNIGDDLGPDQIENVGEHLRVYVAANIGTHLLKNINDAMHIAECKLELGSVATPFVPDDPATNLAKCQRYYFTTGGDVTLYCTRYDTGTSFANFTFPVTMRQPPNCSATRTTHPYNQPINTYKSPNHCQVWLTVQDGVGSGVTGFTADAEL